MVDAAFLAALVVATVVQSAIVILLCIQIVRARADQTPRDHYVITAGDAVAGVAVFVGAALPLGWLLHGSDALAPVDALVYGCAFGIVGAALAQQLRQRGSASPRLALLLPLAAGVLAGLAAA